MTDATIRIDVDASGARRGARVIKRDLKDIDGAAGRARKGVGALRGALATLGAAFIVRELVRLSDTYANLEGRLKTVTNGLDELRAIQTELLRVSQTTRTDLEATTGLFVKLATVGGELGVSQSQLISFTESVGKALRLSGASAQSASGALMQLSQAIGGGIVRAEEFNSILEGAPVIIQTVARNLDAAGGSVGKLRTLVSEGDVTSREFFDAFQKGADDLAESAKDLPRTVGQAFTQLENGILSFVGVADQSIGATSEFAEFIGDLGILIGNASVDVRNSADKLNDSNKQVIDWSNTFLSILAFSADGIRSGFKTISTILGAAGLTIAADFAIITKLMEGDVDGALNVVRLLREDVLALGTEFVNFDASKFRDAFDDAKDGITALSGTLKDNTDEISDNGTAKDELSDEAIKAAEKVDDLRRSIQLDIEVLRIEAKSGKDAAAAYREITEAKAVLSGASKQTRKDTIDEITLRQELQDQIKAENDLTDLARSLDTPTEAARRNFREQRDLINEGADHQKNTDALIAKNKQQLMDKLQDINEQGSKDITDQLQRIEFAAANTFRNLEDAIVQFAKTGKLEIGDLVDSILEDFLRLAIQEKITRPLADAFGSAITGFFGGGSASGMTHAQGVAETQVAIASASANGNVFSMGNQLKEFAKGGIVDSPTLFPMADGVGSMSENEPEAIMPLARGRGGRLGVAAEGLGGGGNTFVEIIDQRGADAPKVETSQRSQGGDKIIRVLVRQEIERNINSGGLDKTLGRNFNLQRNPVNR